MGSMSSITYALGAVGTSRGRSVPGARRSTTASSSIRHRGSSPACLLREEEMQICCLLGANPQPLTRQKTTDRVGAMQPNRGAMQLGSLACLYTRFRQVYRLAG